MIHRNEFPNLRDGSFEMKSDPDEAYNCIAWAAGANDLFWDPDEDHYWPIAEREYTVSALISVFAHLGFEPCDDGEREEGVQKIALYGIKGVYEHAARQLQNGQWTSKLGPEDDIRHSSPADLAGGNYGEVVAFMKRPYPDEPALGDDG
jgi:hypothetical protein